MMQNTESGQQAWAREDEHGYLLLGLTVMIFIMLLMMAVAAPLVAKDLERQKELMSADRAREYVRAIQLYYRKTGHYPTAMEQLDETNNMHFLRRHYVDPLTGGEYRLIRQGQNQTTVKGFFGEPLQGISSSTGMSSGGIASSGGTGLSSSSGSAFGSSSGSSLGSSSSSSSFSLGSGVGSSSTSFSSTGTSSGTSTGTGIGSGSQDATTFGSGGIGPFIGVGTTKTGHAIYAQNGEDEFTKWEFLYDPRVDALKAKVNILGGGVGSTNATDLSSPTSSSGSSFGSLFGNGSSSSSSSSGTSNSSSGASGSSSSSSGNNSGSSSTPQ